VAVEDKSAKPVEEGPTPAATTSFRAAPSSKATLPQATTRTSTVLRIHARERTITSHITILRGIKPTDFASVSLAAKQFFFSRLKQAGPSSSLRSPSAAGGSRIKDPIILLSPSASSLVTMHNVKSFLEEGRFVEPGQAALEAGGGRGPEVLHISHKSNRFGGKPVRYVVVEGVEKFRPDYWDRVVCVFTTGIYKRHLTFLLPLSLTNTRTHTHLFSVQASGANPLFRCRTSMAVSRVFVPRSAEIVPACLWSIRGV